MTVKVAITGVSGHLGGLIAGHILRKSSSAVVHGICRNPDKLSSSLTSNDRFKVFKTGHDDAQKLREAVRGTDIAIFATLGDPEVMHHGQTAVIDACLNENVPRYFAGDWSLDFRPLKLGDLPPKDPMKKVNAHLEEIEQKTNGKLKSVHVLNGAFMEVVGPALISRKGHAINYWGSKDGTDAWDTTTYDNAAEVTADLALDTNATGWYLIRGDRVSASDVAREYEKAFGVKPEFNHRGSFEEMYKTMHAIKESKPPNVWAWMGLFYTYYSTNGECVLKEPLDNKKFPDVKWNSLADYFKAAKQPERIGMPYEAM